MGDGSNADNGDVLTASQHVLSAAAPIDRNTELDSIVNEMRTFIAGENRHANLDGCLTVRCKTEEIEDAVYALGIVFDLHYSDSRGNLCVTFTLRSNTPTVVDDDEELRGIIRGDLLDTPIRSIAKKLRKWILDPTSSTSVRVSNVEKAKQLASLFRLAVWQPEGTMTVILTKPRKSRLGKVIDERRLELVLRQRRVPSIKKGLRKLAKNGPVKSLVCKLRQFTSDVDGPRSMTIPCDAFNSKAAKLADVFSLDATPESDVVILTKRTQGPIVVGNRLLADVLSQNGKRQREEDEEVEVLTDSFRAPEEKVGFNIDEEAGKLLKNGCSEAKQFFFKEIPDLQQVSDISLLEKRLQEFADDPDVSSFVIPFTADPRLAPLAKSLHLKLTHKGGQTIVRNPKFKKESTEVISVQGSQKKLKISASSEIPEEFPDIDPSVLRLWLKTFVDDDHAPAEMTIPPTGEKTRDALCELATAFGLNYTLSDGFVTVRKAVR
ncbi:uncharacterized protein EV420DRAFT_1639149 [Desarmillaria tabescens]|uniref:Uncharacterized protein n=1 Tax=Armillaria tabescens TaxID=1929756 RepID=A0AA39NCN3_ARMTA|nr:uncharacterized protein EV420DRAFT_1639149 [Desarmillaria tabescens]KAK0463058.1 hypothetical protein EV420DRAFT_1639149 [Desarmillaria tabescens]